MGYGLPAAVGAQVANPKKLVYCISGEASILMNIQELSTIKQYRLPIKLIILNNGYMGMVKQWQQLFFGDVLSKQNQHNGENIHGQIVLIILNQNCH